MRLGMTLAAVVAVALVAMPTDGPAASAHGRGACLPSGAELLAANSYVVVWRARRARPDRYFGCYRRRGTRTLLGVRISGQEPENFQLAGRFVAYANEGCDRGGGGCIGAIVVRDLRDGSVSRAPIPRNQGGTFVLAVSERGAVAWVRISSPFEGQVEVRVLDEHGERTLASGGLRTDIDPYSLAISKTHVYWVERGVVRSAPVGALSPGG